MKEKGVRQVCEKKVDRRKFLKVAGATAAVMGLTRSAPLRPCSETNRHTAIPESGNRSGTIKMLNQAFEEYKTKTGVQIVMDSVPSTDVFIKLSTSIKAGQPYDIGNILFVETFCCWLIRAISFP